MTCSLSPPPTPHSLTPKQNLRHPIIPQYPRLPPPSLLPHIIGATGALPIFFTPSTELPNRACPPPEPGRCRASPCPSPNNCSSSSPSSARWAGWPSAAPVLFRFVFDSEAVYACRLRMSSAPGAGGGWVSMEWLRGLRVRCGAFGDGEVEFGGEDLGVGHRVSGLRRGVEWARVLEGTVCGGSGWRFSSKRLSCRCWFESRRSFCWDGLA